MLSHALKKLLIAQPNVAAVNCARGLNDSVAYYFYGYWFSPRRA